jgi:carbamoyltransferase
MTRALREETGLENLCLAGGVALNCVANGKVLRDGQFKHVWVQPAAGDAGGALGAALAAHHLYRDQPRTPRSGQDSMRGSYLGPRFEQADIEARLTAAGARFSVLPDTDLIERTASLLASENVVGWFQGRMEFGPRALGGRSILGDPRSPKMQSVLNLKIKYRESFRPFAPSVLREHVAEWFDLDQDSPYMLIVADVAAKHRIDAAGADKDLFGIEKLKVPRSTIPAVTHVDYSARIQTVHADTNPRYHALISRFYGKTGCPVLINTSFNVRGEPIVCTPEDAFRCLMGTEMDALVIGNCVLMKTDQDSDLRLDYKNAFDLD